MLLRVAKRNGVTITLFSLLIISILLMSLDVKKRGRLNILEEFIIDAASVVQRGTIYSIEAVRDIWFGYIYLVGVQEENGKLKIEAAELREKLNSAREAVKENERLRDLLAFKDNSSRNAVSAKLIGVDPTGFFKSITISKGSIDGVKKGMAVVTNNGVVGRVIGTSANSSKVLLVFDRNSDVDATVQRSRERGIVEGGDKELMQLKYLARGADVQIDDIVVTSGVGGVFPKGLVIGYVSKVDKASGGIFLTAEIKPAVDFSRLEEVLVIIDSPESSGV